MKQQPWPIGAVSEATLRVEDLLPVLAEELERTYNRQGTKIPRRHRELIEAASDTDSEYAEHVLDELYYALNELAPPYVYFGGTDSDPACIGWWPDFFALGEDIRSGEVPQLGVGDLPPKDYSGFVVEVTDHGNVSLVEYKSGRYVREVWGCV